MKPNEIAEKLRLLHEAWQVVEGKRLVRKYQARNFVDAVEVVNKIAAVAEAMGHHPNLTLHDYRYLTIEIYTHTIDELDEKDFVLAGQIDTLLGR